MSEVTRTRLENGLTILTEELHDAPVVALQAWVHVGSADETEDVAGVAHLHEHMLFKGTPTRGVGEIARTVEAAGGEINAWTSFDETVYHVVMAAQEAACGLDILADALRHSLFDAQELEREIEVVLEEIRRAEDAPSRRAANAMFSLAFTQHPYGRPVLGSEKTVRALSRERILAFYRAHYRPERITLVAAGDFHTPQLLELVRKSFGDWAPTRERHAVTRTPEPAARALRCRLLKEDVKETRMSVAWHGPSLRHHDLAAVDALAVILGHGDSSRLFSAVRRQHQWVHDVYAYAYTPRDAGLFVMGCTLNAQHVQQALAGMVAEAVALRETPVADRELEKARVQILSDSAYARETVQGQARKLGFFEVTAGDYAFEEAYLASVKRLTPADIQRVARLYLNAHPALVLQVPQASDITQESLQAWFQEGWQAANDRLSRGAAALRPKPAHRAPRGEDSMHALTLPCGARLFVRREDSPVVAMRAVGLGGQRWEQESNAGLGHFFGSVWGTATVNRSGAAMAEHVEALGGSLGAFAGRNSVGLRGDFVAEKASEGLEAFCEALVTPAFNSAEIERERAATLERIFARDDNPAAVAMEMFSHLVHKPHSYGLPYLGTQETVKSFSAEALVAYHGRFAALNRLVIFVTGGVDPARVVEMLTARLKEFPASQPEPLSIERGNVGAQPSNDRHHRVLQKQQSHVIIGGLGVTLFDRARHAAEVLTTVLSGQSGRLFLDLRDQQSLAYSVASHSLEGLDPGHILVHMGTSPQKVPQAIRGVRAHLTRVCDEAISEEELARAKRYLIGTHAIGLQRTGARAIVMALDTCYGLGYEAHKTYNADIQAVTAADVQAFAQAHLAAEKLTEVVVGPEAASV